MMETQGQAGSSRRLPAGLAGMLVLVAVVELVIGGRRLDFTTVWADDWRQTAEAVSVRAPGRDVLCFGDSLVKFGVLPRVIEAEAHLKAYNLAISAGTMPAIYFLFERTIRSGARPRAVVADFFALMLVDKPRESIRNYPELASWGHCADLAWVARDGDLFTWLALGKVMPSVRCRFEIRNSITAALDGRRASPWPASRWIWTTWKNHLGAQPMPVLPGQPAVLSPGLVADLTPGHWTLDPINANYFERFVSLAEAHAIPVFWIMPPLGPEVRAGRVARGTDLAYSELARQAQAKHPDLVVLDARGSGYDGSAHIDPIHLNAAGATVLSGDITSAIADHLDRRDSARWRDLPRFAGRTEGGRAAEVAVGTPAGAPR